MAGVDIDVGRRGRRRSLDSDINMIPMIDLMMVTVSFLLITAQWTLMARLDAEGKRPGAGGEAPEAVERTLHIEARTPGRFVLEWKRGHDTVDSIDVPRADGPAVASDVASIRYPELAAAIESEWKTKGQHTGAGDVAFDRAVVHAPNDMPAAALVAIFDAVRQPKRALKLGAKTYQVAAIRASLATD
jgi:hypothetical protein